MRIDYYAYCSGMKNWNAGIKFFLSVVTICLVIGLNRITVSLFVVFSMGALTLLAGRIPGRVYCVYDSKRRRNRTGVCRKSGRRLEYVHAFFLFIYYKRGNPDGSGSFF